MAPPRRVTSLQLVLQSFQGASDPDAKKRYAASTAVSVVVIAGLTIGAVVAAGAAQRKSDEDKQIDVQFKKPEPPPKPPAPPPPPEAKKLRKRPPAPVLAMAPPPPPVAPPPIVAPPKATERPKEADPATAKKDTPPPGPRDDVKGGKPGGKPGGVPGGTGTGEAGGDVEVAAGPRATPINLPEEGTPPEPLEDNVMPEFPEAARAEGKEGVVILKVVISIKGKVTKVDVMKGDEPFVAAAVAAVKTWRYKPAMVDGQPQSVFKIVKIPFRIKS